MILLPCRNCSSSRVNILVAAVVPFVIMTVANVTVDYLRQKQCLMYFIPAFTTQPSHRALLHFGQYSFSILRGWEAELAWMAGFIPIVSVWTGWWATWLIYATLLPLGQSAFCTWNTHRCSVRSMVLLYRYWGQSAFCWLHGTVVEHQSLAGELSLSCARPVADGWPLTWVSRPL